MFNFVHPWNLHLLLRLHIIICRTAPYASIVHNANVMACYLNSMEKILTAHHRPLPAELIILYAQNYHGIQYVCNVENLF